MENTNTENVTWGQLVENQNQMFALPRRPSTWFLSKCFQYQISPLNSAGSTQQMALNTIDGDLSQSCFECANPSLSSLNSKLAESTVSSSQFFWNTLPSVGICGCLVELNINSWGPQNSSEMLCCSSREVIGYTESQVAIEKPKELTV